VQVTAKPAAHWAGAERSRAGGGGGRSSLLRSFQQWNRSHRQLSGKEQSLPPRDIQRLPTTPFPLVLRMECILTVLRETLTQYIIFNRGGESSLYSRTLLAVPRWINYCCVMQFLPFLCLQGSLFFVDWNCTLVHSVYTTLCTQKHCILFLVKTIAVKITRDLSTVTSCIDLSVRIVTKSQKVGPLLIFSISLVLPNSSSSHRTAWKISFFIRTAASKTVLPEKKVQLIHIGHAFLLNRLRWQFFELWECH